MWRGLPELEAVEGAGGAPLLDVGEVSAGAVGVAAAEERGARVLALVVVVARGAVRSADHAARPGQQQVHPRRLGVGRRLDRAEPALHRVPDHRRDGPGGVDDVVRYVGDQVRALRGLHEQQVREPADVDAVQRAHPAGPVLRQRAVAACHLEASPPGVRRADLEAGAVDDAVELVLPPGRHHALSLPAVAWSRTMTSARARISSIFSKSDSSYAASIAAGLSDSGGSAAIRARIRRAMSVQPSCTRSTSAAPPAWLAVKFSSQRCCHPGVATPANQPGSIGWLSRASTEDGVRWNTYSSRASLARCGTHWTAVAPVPMRPTRLSASLSITAP